MELIVVRHGTTQGNLERRFIGTIDMPLHPSGEELARRVSATLPPVDHVYHSPLIRCRQTAELLWPTVERTVVDGLRETDFGCFEGKNHEELKDDPLYQAWISQDGGPDFADSPVGETVEQVMARVKIALEQIVADMHQKGYERVAAVSHGGALMGLLTQFARPERAYYDWFCPNCGGYLTEICEEPLELRVKCELGGERAL